MQVRGTDPKGLIVDTGGVIACAGSWGLKRTQRIDFEASLIEVLCDLHGPKDEGKVG